MNVKAAIGQEFPIRQLSSLEEFARFIKRQREDNPVGEHELYAMWQQAQYMYSMFSTHHHHLVNRRYENLSWTTGLEYIQSFAR